MIKRAWQIYKESWQYLHDSFGRTMPNSRTTITATSRDAKRLLWQECRQNLPMVIGIFICIVVVAEASVLLPVVGGIELINGVLLGDDSAKLWGTLFLLAGIYLAQGFCQSIQTFLSGRLQNRINMSLKERITAHLLKLPGDFFDKTPSGYLASRVFEDTRSMSAFFGVPMQSFLVSIFKIVSATVALFWLKWELGLIVLAVIPVIFFAARLFGKKHYTLAAHNSETTSAAYGRLQETISNIKLVKSSGEESGTLSGHSKDYKNLYKINMEMTSLMVIFQRAMTLLPDACRFVILVLCCMWILDGKWAVGELTAVLGLVQTIFSPTKTAAYTLVQMASAHASLARLGTLLKLIPEDNIDSGIEINQLNGDIEFKGVDFEYLPESPILADFSLQIPAHKFTAIVGASGVGKSTLASLIMHFYRVPKGEILVDGVPLNEYNIKSLRRRIGFLGTDMKLFNDSLRANLCYGNSNQPNDEQIIEVLTKLGLANLLQSEQGLEQIVEESAKNLSAGQQQRIAIARELLNQNSDVLILDEPTSALDGEHEKLVAQAISHYASSRTIIVITHREKLAMVADNVVLLKDRQNAGEGSYRELTRKFGNICATQ